MIRFCLFISWFWYSFHTFFLVLFSSPTPHLCAFVYSPMILKMRGQTGSVIKVGRSYIVEAVELFHLCSMISLLSVLQGLPSSFTFSFQFGVMPPLTGYSQLPLPNSDFYGPLHAESFCWRNFNPLIWPLEHRSFQENSSPGFLLQGSYMVNRSKHLSPSST